MPPSQVSGGWTSDTFRRARSAPHPVWSGQSRLAATWLLGLQSGAGRGARGQAAVHPEARVAGRAPSPASLCSASLKVAISHARGHLR